MDRPFREVHELYKILYQRAEAQQKAEEERQKKEQEEENKRKRQVGPTPQYSKQQPPDAINTMPTPSPLEMEALEDMFEEIM